MAAVAAGDLCTSLPNVPEFPRHQLRLLEKLGEGAFGMVILHSQWLKITQKSSFLLFEPFPIFAMLWNETLGVIFKHCYPF